MSSIKGKSSAPKETPPMVFPVQERPWKQLLTYGEGGESLPQALLLLGPHGVGKQFHAHRYYQWIHCERRTGQSPCEECTSCLKIAHGNHPDLIEIAPSGDQILIDDLREMKTRLFFPPVEGRLRLVVIRDAHKLNAASANSILKTLEEPPKHTRFFLLTSEKSLLLPTILSRCQFVYFAPIEPHVLRGRLLEAADARGVRLNETQLSLLIELCGDGIARAESLLTEGVLEFLNEFGSRMKGLNSYGQIVALAEELAADGSKGSGKLELMIDLITLMGRNAALQAVQKGDLAAAYSKCSDALALAGMRRRLERSPNRKLAAFHTALQLTQNSRS